MNLLMIIFTALIVIGAGIFIWAWHTVTGTDVSFDEIGPFSEGLAPAKRGKKCCHIHPDGTRAYRRWYDQVGNFSKGVAWVRKGREWFQIHPNGTRVS